MSMPQHLVGLVDDTSLFSSSTNAPGADLDTAVADHRDLAGTEMLGLARSFAVSDARLAELIELTGRCGSPGPRLATTVHVSGGAGAMEPIARTAGRAPGLELVGIEMSLAPTGTSVGAGFGGLGGGGEEDLARNAQRMLAMAQHCLDELDDEPGLVVELPRIPHGPTSSWLGALDELAMADVPAAFRLDGPTEDAFMGADELAVSIGAALDRELAFTCTAGLHRAVCVVDQDTGRTRHGFANVLLATQVSLDSGSVSDVVDALRDPDPVRSLGSAERLASTRRWFTGFGCRRPAALHPELLESGLWNLT